jgi:DNA-binding NtrC family response regulator
VLDDDRDAADMLAAVLHRRLEKSTLRVFYDAGSAIAAVLEQTPDVVISDLEMPDVDGHDFALVVRIACAAERSPVLVAASGSSTELAHASQRGTFDHCFLKPLHVQAIVNLLRVSTSVA